MKKNILALAVFAVASWIALPSCSPNSDNNPALQAPETAQTEAVQGTSNPEKDDDEGEKGKTNKVNLNTAGAKAVTANNLITAFTGETTASAKYAAYSKKAQEEGYTQIALLFKAASMSEKIHADNHKSVLDDMGMAVPEVKPQYSVKTTAENLNDAIAGESYEISTMYPQFLTAANSEGNQLGLISLNYAYKTEQKHKVFYEKALAALQSKQVNTLAAEYWVCPTCGNTYDNAAPKRCGISMTRGDRFVKVNSL